MINLKEEITKKAYLLWEKDGQPENKSEYYWELAEKEINEHYTRYGCNDDFSEGWKQQIDPF